MSILNTEQRDPVSPAKRSATRIKRATQQMANTILTGWEQSFDALWNNPRVTPEEVLAELGTDAAEVFELSAKTVAYMAQIMPDRLDADWARLQAKIAAKPETKTNPDGSVELV